MKIRVGIVGYGNLGKATERMLIKHNKYKLVAIFSRRMVTSAYGTIVEPYEAYSAYKHKIDIMLLCGGSKYDLIPQTEEMAKYFDCINTFDTHAKIEKHLHLINKIAKQSRHRCIISCGWDPGLFSVIRALFYKISNVEPYTFWGKGISMGHSDAIRTISGVDDGVQFTIPNSDAIMLAKKGCLDDSTPKHFRECFVLSENGNKSKIEGSIKNIPNYFKGQPTSVRFVSREELLRLKSKMFHSGEIINNFTDTSNQKYSLTFKVKMSSNPDFTAKIMVLYINALVALKKNCITGAVTPLDIPVSLLFDNHQKMLRNFC